MKVVVSAPGKVILMGEHSAVYGHPALIAAIDRRTTASLDQQNPAGGQVRLSLPAIEVEETVDWDDIHDLTERCRRAWEHYRSAPSPEAFAEVRGEDPAHLVKIALGEAAAATGQRRGGPSLTLRLTSTIPIGSGFGSSAAAATAIVCAYLRARGSLPTIAAAEPIVLAAERRQHGSPSGIDGATILRGGVVWASRGDRGGLDIEPIVAAPEALARFSVFQTGIPTESTGAVVADVRRRRDLDPRGFDVVLGEMAGSTRAFRDALGPGAPATAPVQWIQRFERGLEKLGVVPPPIRGRIRAIERAGGGAKISGAGTLSGAGAGSLLVYHPRGHGEAGLDALGDFEHLAAALGAEGVRSEPADA